MLAGNGVFSFYCRKTQLGCGPTSVVHGRFRSLLSPSRRRAREDLRRGTYSSGESLLSISAAALGSAAGASAGAGARAAAGVADGECVGAAAGTGAVAGAAPGSGVGHAPGLESGRTLSSPLQVASPGSDIWTP